MTDQTKNSDSSLKEQLSRLIIENQSGDGSIDISDQAAMRDEVLALITSRDQQIAKAYGGCTNCYGKGYSTYSGEYSARDMSWPDEKVKYCDCSRGKQLEVVHQQIASAAKLNTFKWVRDNACLEDIAWIDERIAEVDPNLIQEKNDE